VKTVYKRGEKDISSILLTVTKTKGRRYNFQRQLKKMLLHRHAFVLSWMCRSL